MQQNYNEMPVLRDKHAADEVRMMASLGMYPQEITVYGLSYFNNGERHYLLSTVQRNLIDFLNNAANEQYYPSDIYIYSESKMIPEGYSGEITNTVKAAAGKRLQQMYPAQVFRLLEEMHSFQATVNLDEDFRQMRAQLEPIFDLGSIEAFRELCVRAFLRKNMTEAVYQSLDLWCEKRIAAIESYLPPLKDKEKTFYGFAVVSESGITCFINANLDVIYRERLDYERRGIMVTAICKKQFLYERQESLQSLRKCMEEEIRKIYDERMLDLLKKTTVKADFSIERKEEIFSALASLGDEAVKIGEKYANRWGI